MGPQRVLAAVVFTDTVGFTKRTGENEEEAFGLLHADVAIMRELAVRYEGQVKKSTGDGLLMVFQSAMQAVSCAVEIQRRLGEEAKRNPKALKHRIGIHLGDVFLSEDDVIGDGVNVANRLQGEAQPGAICMSHTVYDLVKTRLPIQAKPLGERKLRNVATTVSVFEIPPLFGPRAGQKLPSIHRSPPPKKSNGGIVAAIVFAGLCILAAAVILAFRDLFPKPDAQVAFPKPSGDTAGKHSAPSGATGGGKENPPPATTDPDAPIANAEELAALVPATGDSRQTYDNSRAVYKASYDFDGMLGWLEGQTWISEPGGKRLQAHWKRLKHFKEDLLAALMKTGPDHQLAVGEDSYYSTTGTSVFYTAKGATPVEVQFLDLKPDAILGLAKAVGIHEPSLNAFALEYGLGG